jgi:hypothetical protein
LLFTSKGVKIKFGMFANLEAADLREVLGFTPPKQEGVKSKMLLKATIYQFANIL